MVYLAMDQTTNESVIIKQANSDEQWSQDALRHEAMLLRSLHHKGIPRFIDYFVEFEGGFLVLSQVKGNDLADIMEEKVVPFNYDDAIQITFQLLDVVEYLQTMEVVVVHRDIKPKNVMLTPDKQVYLLDFGISKRIGSVTLIPGGTPRYAPPEQLKDEGSDGRADIYGIAATAYYLLTGTKPPDALNREKYIAKGFVDPLVALTELNSNVPALVSRVFLQALSLQREERPNSASVMSQWLEAAIGGNPALDVKTLTLPTKRSNSTNRSIPRSIVVVPIDSPTPGDVTAVANQVLTALEDGKLTPEIIQLLIEVLDNKLERRLGLLDRRIEQFFDNSRPQASLASNLFQSLAANLYIDPEVKKKLRHRLGRALAGHILSESPGNLSAVRSRAQNNDSKQALHRNLAVWAVRGLIVGVLCQTVGTLVIGRTFLDVLSTGTSWISPLVHIVLLGLGVLFVYHIHQNISRTGYNISHRYLLYGSFCLGLMVAIVAFHDLAQILFLE